MPDETEMEPKDIHKNRRHWNKATHTKVIEKHTGDEHDDVDIWQVEVPGTYIIKQSKYPQGVVVLNEIDFPLDDNIRDTEIEPDLMIEIRYYPPGGQEETVVEITDNQGWPNGKIVIWKPMA